MASQAKYRRHKLTHCELFDSALRPLRAISATSTQPNRVNQHGNSNIS
jgi:hypothetical protein